MKIRKHRLTLPLAAALFFVPAFASGQPPKIESQPSIVSKLNPFNWSAPDIKMPSMNFMTTSQKKPTAKPKPPGFWSNLGKSTRSAWDKTTDVLNPFDDGAKKPAKKPAKKSAKSKKSTGGFFSQLLKPKEEPKPVSTVGDFLQQPFPY